jgi:hypothetical protein
MTVFSALGVLVTTVAFVVDMILWNIVRQRIRDDTSGNSAALSNANWMTLAGLLALVLATCAAGCGSFGRYQRRKREFGS